MDLTVDDGWNFQTELMKAICQHDTENINYKVCLISGSSLEDEYVELACKHQFNYSSIFHEIFKQKKNPSSLETQKLTKYQIKCPYCRNIQYGLLPYCKKFNKKEIYINWPPKHSYSQYKCQAIIKTGKRKGQKCDIYCVGEHCYKHGKHKNRKICNGVCKSGKRKGLQCTYRAVINGFCKVHNKINSINI